MSKADELEKGGRIALLLAEEVYSDPISCILGMKHIGQWGLVSNITFILGRPLSQEFEN